MTAIDPTERHLLLEGIFLKYGYDFREYSRASMDRRLIAILRQFEMTSPMALLHALYDSKDFFQKVLPHLTVTTTEAFRDPSFFKSLREKVLPVLKTYPMLRIWVAGCSTGEELYSLAILLKEEGLYERSTIFATDINPKVLGTAREGIYNIDMIQGFTKNYFAAGGVATPSDYYTAEYGLARMAPELRANVVFSQHNLVIDRAFTEAHLILCRNVMIYFSKALQEHVLSLFDQSLSHRGFLALGSKESLRFSAVAGNFAPTTPEDKIFQKQFGIGTYSRRHKL